MRMRAAQRPCSNCPWRRDSTPGEFPPERYEALAATTGGAGREAPVGAPMFACHKTAAGKEIACAGWLAREGYHHLGVRMAVAMGRVDVAALEPGEDWPALYDSYDELASVNGATL